MTLMKAKKPLALLLALLAALSLLGTTALAAGLPEETIAAQTELCGEDCGHTHEEVFSHTEHAEESLPEPEEIAVPVATPLLEQPEPEAEQPSDIPLSAGMTKTIWTTNTTICRSGISDIL